MLDPNRPCTDQVGKRVKRAQVKRVVVGVHGDALPVDLEGAVVLTCGALSLLGALGHTLLINVE